MISLGQVEPYVGLSKSAKGIEVLKLHLYAGQRNWSQYFGIVEAEIKCMDAKVKGEMYQILWYDIPR